MKIITKSKEIVRRIKKANKIYVTGHKNMDLDALASATVFHYIAKHYKKQCYIIIDDKEEEQEQAVQNAYEHISKDINRMTTGEIEENQNGNLLIVVDTNKINTIQNTKLLDIFTNILIIDHHDTTENTIKNAEKVIENKTSSTSEMITFFLKRKKIKIPKDMATVLLSGIALDTNNFTLKTTIDTFKASHILTELGAEPSEVQYIMKQDINEYIERQKIITNVELKGNIAIAKGSENTIYKREELAKTADTILFFNNIEASFVIGKLSHNTIGISARSLGSVEVQTIMEKFNGGGDKHNAACIVKNKTIEQVEKDLFKII